MLNGGAQKDARTKQGYTPLHIACHHGHINMVRLLIEQGAEVNPSTVAGYTPLHQAAQQGHVLVINLLLKNKANPNAVTSVSISILVEAFFLRYVLLEKFLRKITIFFQNQDTQRNYLDISSTKMFFSFFGISIKTH